MSNLRTRVPIRAQTADQGHDAGQCGGDCISPDGKITEEGWDLLNLKNPHKKEK